MAVLSILRGPELLRAGQESNQIARAVDQYRKGAEAYPKRLDR